MDLNRLPTELEQFVQQEIAEGKYQSAEEVVSAALRLLQEHEAQSHNGEQFANGHGDTKPHSADNVLQAISNALATGKPGLARKLALDGAKQYPDYEELRKYARVLAPPTVTQVGQIQTPSIRASRQWLRAHGQDYIGQWVAVRDGKLLYASPSFDELSAHVDEAENTFITQVH
jgi:putative addiction module CopG family antidote